MKSRKGRVSIKRSIEDKTLWEIVEGECELPSYYIKYPHIYSERS